MAIPVDPFDAPYLSSQIVGIGTGGSLTLQFNTPIQNNPNNPFGLDFIIFGHAGFQHFSNGDYSGGGVTDGSLYTGGTSDVRVSVSADGTTFYTLNPALTPQVDGLYPTDGSGNPFLPVNPALTAADFAGQDLTGIRALYNGSAGGAGFSLGWAIDSNGQSVFLSSVDYVRLDVLNDGTPAYLDAISVVPEPASWMLVLTGAGLFFLRQARLRTCAPVCLFCGAWLPPRSAGRQPSMRISPAIRNRTAGKSLATPTCSSGMPTIRISMSPGIHRKPTVIFIIPSEPSSRNRTDFSLSFDLQLSDIAVGVDSNKPDTFELAVGFINLLNATSTNLERGVGINATHGARNLCEFDYFPDSGYGATISPTLISSNNQFATMFAHPFAMDPGALFHVDDDLHRQQPNHANERDPQWQPIRHDQRGPGLKFQ